MASGRRVGRGNRNIAWIESHCFVPEGALVGQPVKLRAWQKKIIRGLYDRPIRRAIISMGRKNGKSSFAAFLTLLHLVGPEARPNSQLFSAAQSRDQAAILFSLAAKMVRMNHDLLRYVTVRDTAKQLFCQELGTLYRALSADASTAYGLSPVFVVHDELGQVRGPRSELYEALETASGAQVDPLSVIISTQAPKAADLLSVLIDDARTNPETKLFLYTAPPERDPFTKTAIKAANPAFGDFLNPKVVMEQAEGAKRMPSREAAFRNLILNQQVNMTDPFVTRSVWEANAGAPDFSLVREVYIGVDLSARNDLTALVVVGRDEDGVFHVAPYFYTPLQGLQERAHRDREPYDLWVREGYITATPGASIDYAYAAEQLVELCDTFHVKSIPFDRWRIDVLKQALGRRAVELPLIAFGQGFKDMTPALDTLESLLLDARIRHGGHPVLDMCAENAVATRDPAGNKKLDKSKATGRIDGMVALAMAIGAANTDPIENKPPLRMFALG
jgi:phage terminase large subunit-like protein